MTLPSILHYEPEEVVDMALGALHEAGIMLVEWRALLSHRMNVPVVIRDFSYLVPDDSLLAASSILSKMNLPLSTYSDTLLTTTNGFHTKGRFHRITQHTSPALVQHFVLYPLSFSTLSRSELREDAPFHTHPRRSQRCQSIYVPSKPALYASIIRLVLSYQQVCATSLVLYSELYELIVYDLLGYDIRELNIFYEGDVDWDTQDSDERLEKALWTIKSWGVDGAWREGEEWMQDALGGLVIGGKADPAS